MKKAKFFRFTASYVSDGKRVKEDYLVEASCYTEAEANATREMEGREGLAISNIRPVSYHDVIGSDGGIYYEVRADFVTLDERNGAERRAAERVLTLASSVADAVSAHEEYMRGTLSDYELLAVKKTKFIDVFVY